LEERDFCVKTIDKPCDLLEWLSYDTYEFETSYSYSYIPSPWIYNYASPVCEICHCYDHDNTSCPYYIFYDGFAGLSSMIEIINKQRLEFAQKMRERDLPHQTDLRFSSPRLGIYLCNDRASFAPLKSVLQALLDPPVTTSSLVAPSSPSTFRNNATLP